MEQKDIKKTPVTPPEGGGLKAIDKVVDNAIDKVFAEYYNEKDVRGSIDVSVEGPNPKKEHSYTLYARLGYLLDQHGCRSTRIMIGDNEYAIKVHASVVDQKHLRSETVASELVDDVIRGILHGMPPDKSEGTFVAALRYLILENTGYFTKPMLYAQAAKIGITDPKKVDRVLNELMEDDIIVLVDVGMDPEIPDPDMPGKAFRRAAAS
ncbi:hypothetical protein IKQ65_00815 [Candidatus Saccharibacteria bacterium]|nr:hypothetical protein [Candidatus Saccharibacteria bacterium]MBR6961505.1 hypothetical protein [Candidatus Saccharibacteria bacterium]